jgi:hypothetical protein
MTRRRSETRRCRLRITSGHACRISRVWVGQPGWRPVMVTAGGPARARVSARRRASGSRYQPAMRRTRSAASVAGIPAAVTNSGRAEAPRRTGTARVAVRNLDLATPSPGCQTRRVRARPGRAGRPGPGRRSRRPRAGPARSHLPGPRAAAGARACRTRWAGRAVPWGSTAVRSASTCAKAASAASTAAARAPPVLR